jgi:hypothetical protein
VDVGGPNRPNQEGNTYNLTMQDDLSTLLIAVPMKEQTAEELAKPFVENVLIYRQP